MDLQKKTRTANSRNENVDMLLRLALGLVVGYAAAAVLFYFLAGEQLHLRQSRGNVDLPAADSGIVELVGGSIVEQVQEWILEEEQVAIGWDK